MIDLKRLHKAATDALTGNGVNTEMACAMQALQLLTCPDPLTLDAAVQVVGREPDEHDILQHEGHELWGWTPERIRVRRWLESETFDVLCGFTKYDNPTIGQFACLVAAARMGEQS